jgi:ribulose-5-phosphate 4-epimerase/fuculose-1-phosphate aldolase
MDEFVRLCKAFGPLEELVQAGGGNISVKLTDTVSVIKASGVALSDVTHEKGYALVYHRNVEESLASSEEPDIMKFVVSGTAKPSLETYFHSFLKKYVVHLHPTALLPFLCKSDPSFIPYHKPGFELSRRIKARYNGESVIYLQNHGVIFTSDSYDELLRDVVHTYEQFRSPEQTYLPEFWNLQAQYPGLYIHRLSVAETRAYLPILRQQNIKPVTPDIALFLHGTVLVEHGSIYIKGPTKQKCLAILEVLRSYCECVDRIELKLTEMQVAEILYWPSEIERRNH